MTGEDGSTEIRSLFGKTTGMYADTLLDTNKLIWAIFERLWAIFGMERYGLHPQFLIY